MKNFTIQPINCWYTNPITKSRECRTFISNSINAFYHDDYQGGNSELRNTEGTVENIITTLKNQFRDKNKDILMQAKNNLIQILKVDLPQILIKTGKTNFCVCVVPRAKAETNYFSNQLFFKRAIYETIIDLNNFSDGTNYIIRHTNTRTTHLDRSGYGGDGDLPYPGITKKLVQYLKMYTGKTSYL